MGTQSVISKCYIALSKYMWAHRANFTMKNKKAELSVKVRRVGGCSGGYRLQVSRDTLLAITEKVTTHHPH